MTKKKEKTEKVRKVILGGVEGAKLRLLRTREIEKKQEEELRKRERTKKEVAVDKITEKIEKALRMLLA